LEKVLAALALSDALIAVPSSLRPEFPLPRLVDNESAYAHTLVGGDRMMAAVAGDLVDPIWPGLQTSSGQVGAQEQGGAAE